LEVVDQQVRPKPVDRLNLTDNSLFEIEAALSPAEDFGNRRFAFQSPEDRMPDRAVLEENLAIPATGFEM